MYAFCVLTILCNKSDAAVHNNRDVIPAQLLVFQCVGFASCCLLNVCVPQRKVCTPHALQVQSPKNKNTHHFDQAVSLDLFVFLNLYICKSPEISKVKAYLPFSTRTKISFFSWFSISDAIPLSIKTGKNNQKLASGNCMEHKNK